MTKPQLVKVEALFYVLQQVTKRDCAYFDTAPLLCLTVKDVRLMQSQVYVCTAYAEADP